MVTLLPTSTGSSLEEEETFSLSISEELQANNMEIAKVLSKSLIITVTVKPLVGKCDANKNPNIILLD